MSLISYSFGDLIEQWITKNEDGKYGPDETIGVNIDKIILPMRGDASKKELTTFFLVPPGSFVYNPRGSRKLGLGYNDSPNTYITTFNNIIFRVKEEAKEIVLPKFLFMYLSRKEWDRKAEIFSWGSSTEVFSWKTFCNMRIDLPPIDIQEKYALIYSAMVDNQRAYEEGLDDLKLICDGYVEELRREIGCEKIGRHLRPSDLRNDLGLGIDKVRGLAVSKQLITTKADMDGVSLGSYKLFPPNHIAYVPDTSRRGNKVSMGFNDTEDTFLLSSISSVFTTDEEYLLAKYLMVFFNRAEFDRYARFHSWGSARETFDWKEMCDVEIPIPDINIQRAIAEMFSAYTLRKEINENLKAKIREVCPILIKGALEEASV